MTTTQTPDSQRHPECRSCSPVGRHGINISRVAEAALAVAFEQAEKAKIREEIREAARFIDEIVREYRDPFPESWAIVHAGRRRCG
jgi:hypothetical protein